MRIHACGVDRVTRAVDPFLKHRNVKIEFNYCQFYPCLYDNTHVSWTPGLGDDTCLGHVQECHVGLTDIPGMNFYYVNKCDTGWAYNLPC